MTAPTRASHGRTHGVEHEGGGDLVLHRAGSCLRTLVADHTNARLS